LFALPQSKIGLCLNPETNYKPPAAIVNQNRLSAPSGIVVVAALKSCQHYCFLAAHKLN
jgi:hypothetical protein